MGVFGLSSAFVGDMIQNWGIYSRPCSALLFFSVTMAIQLLVGTLPLLDNFAHVFGFFMGILCRVMLPTQKREDSQGRTLKTKCCQRFLRMLATVCVPAAFVLGLGLLYRVVDFDADEVCPWCDKMQCLPAPWGCDTSVEGACWWDCSTAQ